MGEALITRKGSITRWDDNSGYANNDLATREFSGLKGRAKYIAIYGEVILSSGDTGKYVVSIISTSDTDCKAVVVWNNSGYPRSSVVNCTITRGANSFTIDMGAAGVFKSMATYTLYYTY